MFWSFPRWFAPSVDGKVLLDSPENLLTQGKFSKVPFIVGQTKDEGAFFYRLTLNAFNNGQYDDNFVDNKLPRILPVLSDFNSKLYPLTRQVSTYTTHIVYRWMHVRMNYGWCRPSQVYQMTPRQQHMCWIQNDDWYHILKFWILINLKESLLLFSAPKY